MPRLSGQDRIAVRVDPVRLSRRHVTLLTVLCVVGRCSLLGIRCVEPGPTPAVAPKFVSWISADVVFHHDEFGSTRYVPNARNKPCLVFMRVSGFTRRTAGRRAKKKDHGCLVRHRLQLLSSVDLPLPYSFSAIVWLGRAILSDGCRRLLT